MEYAFSYYFKWLPYLFYTVACVFLYQCYLRFQISSGLPFAHREKDTNYLFFGLSAAIIILFSFFLPKKIYSTLDVDPLHLTSDLLAYNPVFYLHSTILLRNAFLYAVKCLGIIACLWGIFILNEPSRHAYRNYLALGLLYIMSGILLVNVFEAMIF